ncbi:TIGR03986 family type III CRISPR-associated RAMP protein [Hydrogenobaculum acidophilum]
MNNKYSNQWQKGQTHTNQGKRKPAKAPYNFIPLNEKPIEVEKPPAFDTYYDNRYTGYIDVEITTLTYTYIRKTKQDIDFFKIGDTYKIPGSSLRGLIRTMFEILTYGKFHFFDDKVLSFRAVADKIKNFREAYQEIIQKGVKAGILYKQGERYYIKPAAYDDVTGYDKSGNFVYSGKSYDKYTIDNIKHKGKDAYLLVSGYMKGKKKAYVIHKDTNHEPIEVSEEVIKNYRYDKDRGSDDMIREYMEKKKWKEIPCFYIEEGGKIVEIGFTKNMRVHYKKKISDHIPKELLKEETIDMAEAVFGKSHKKDSFASRVFFEDCNLESGKAYKRVFLKVLGNPKPTSFQLYLEQSTKEPTYEVPKDHLKTWNDNAKIRGYKLYWHKDTQNPQNKAYTYYEKDEQKLKKQFKNCHLEYKDITTLTEEDVKKITNCDKFQNPLVKPLSPGSVFKGRIRFENLTDYELGALLYAIDLPSEENLCHKIGMGKPLGLGSIKITSKLFISDRKERYSKLFDGDNWALGEKEEDKTRFYKSFEDFLKSKLNLKAQSIWDIPRLKELKTMLTYDKSKVAKDEWLEKTRYMLIECECNNNIKCLCVCDEKGKCNEYKDRYVLPKPTEVWKLKEQ